jgi:hypothetical protein
MWLTVVVRECDPATGVDCQAVVPDYQQEKRLNVLVVAVARVDGDPTRRDVDYELFSTRRRRSRRDIQQSVLCALASPLAGRQQYVVGIAIDLPSLASPALLSMVTWWSQQWRFKRDAKYARQRP